MNSGEMAVAFSLHATTMEDLMAVTDAGQVMPPKSTWFEPKLRDGLLLALNTRAAIQLTIHDKSLATR